MNTRSRSMIALKGSLLFVTWQLAGMVTAQADDTAAATSASTDTPPTTQTVQPTLQEVVVTGMRANLEKSLEIKKDATVVLDSINSTELGRFPDDDVADSLSHLPGITIQRTTGGEGEKISSARASARVQHRHAEQPHPRER